MSTGNRHRSALLISPNAGILKLVLYSCTYICMYVCMYRHTYVMYMCLFCILYIDIHTYAYLHISTHTYTHVRTPCCIHLPSSPLFPCRYLKYLCNLACRTSSTLQNFKVRVYVHTVHMYLFCLPHHTNSHPLTLPCHPSLLQTTSITNTKAPLLSQPPPSPLSPAHSTHVSR